MADETSMALVELLRKVHIDTDFLREGVRMLAQALMEVEVTQQLGAGRQERTSERVGYRNGYRERTWDTRVGTIDLQVPRVRDGGYIPSLLEPRRRAERALLSVVQEAYVQGVSTRRVDALVQALGMQGISKSQVSRVCQDLDREGEAFRTRRLEAVYPYVWLDATYIKVRLDGRVVPQAVVIAVGVRMSGEREVLGYDVGPSEEGAFWQRFLRSLVARGLRGVHLVISVKNAQSRKLSRQRTVLITSPFHDGYDDLDAKIPLRLARNTHMSTDSTSCTVYLYERGWKGDMISSPEKRPWCHAAGALGASVTS